MLSNKKTLLFVILLFISSLLFNLRTIGFGVPEFSNGQSRTIYWFNDEDKEVEQIKSLLMPKTEMLFFNYPPFQYMLVDLVYAPARIISQSILSDRPVDVSPQGLYRAFRLHSPVLIFLIGERLYKRCGLFASLLFAVTPLAVMLSKEMKPIALAGTLLLAAIYVSMLQMVSDCPGKSLY